MGSCEVKLDPTKPTHSAIMEKCPECKNDLHEIEDWHNGDCICRSCGAVLFID